jgi:general stress protein 26
MDFADVLQQADRLGPIMYLATVTPAGEHHVVPVHVNWHEGAAWCVTGTADGKTRNIAAHEAVCLHSAVSEETGWDHLMMWGDAVLVTDTATKRRLWSGVFTYDLDEFESGGPDKSPNTGFLRITPRRAVFMRGYGLDGREQWQA